MPRTASAKAHAIKRHAVAANDLRSTLPAVVAYRLGEASARWREHRLCRVTTGGKCPASAVSSAA